MGYSKEWEKNTQNKHLNNFIIQFIVTYNLFIALFSCPVFLIEQKKTALIHKYNTNLKKQCRTY